MAQIIEKLHELVTPSVLGQTESLEGSATDKTSVLSTLYSLLVVRLGDQDTATQVERLNAAELNDGVGLLGILFGGFGTDTSRATATDATGLISALANKFNLPSDTVSSLAGLALPLAVGQLKQLAGARGLQGYLASERGAVLSSMPAWLTALVPAGLAGLFGTNGLVGSVSNLAASATDATTDAVSSAASAVTGAAANTVNAANNAINSVTEPQSSFMKSLLPIIGLIILAGLAFVMLRACQKNDVPVAAPMTTPTASTVTVPTATGEAKTQSNVATAQALLPVALSVSTNDKGAELLGCRALAGAGLSERLKSAIDGVFAGHGCKLEADARHSDDFELEKSLPAILGLIKGQPNVSLDINDKLVRVNAPDVATVNKLIADVKAIVPEGYMVEAEPVLNVAEATDKAISAAKTAIEGLSEKASAEELVNALNLQIINFAVGSSAIPEANQAILDKAAGILQANKDIVLSIKGHTDSTGNADNNKKLSQQRADAVKSYLVSKGVEATRLTAEGKGPSEPVADNATEQGRFKNRRIEFGLTK